MKKKRVAFRAVWCGLLASLVMGCGSAPDGEYVVLAPNLPSELSPYDPYLVYGSGDDFLDIPFLMSRYQVSSRTVRLPEQGDSALRIPVQTADGEKLIVESELSYRLSKEGARVFLRQFGGDIGLFRQFLLLELSSALQDVFSSRSALSFLSPEVQQQALSQARNSLEVNLSDKGVIDLRLSFRSVSTEERLAQEVQAQDRDISTKVTRRGELENQIAQLQREKELVQQQVDRALVKAREQSKRKRALGDRYLEAKQKEVEYLGQELELRKASLEKQLEALSSGEGEVLVKLEILQRLIEANPKLQFLGAEVLGEEDRAGAGTTRESSSQSTAARSGRDELGAVEPDNRQWR